MHKNRRRGVTLTEICVAIAVLSIVSIVVVSFAAMATGRGATGTDKLKFMQDIELLEATVDDWFEAVYTGVGAVTEATESTEPTESTESRWLVANDASIKYENQTLTVAFSEGNTIHLSFETITDVKFEVQPGEGDEIFFCTVTYAYRQGQGKEEKPGTYTFCVNPRVGETLPTQAS